ncbi:MAG: carbohydrate ABC transporter permease [Thermomicrobiales bacterium]
MATVSPPDLERTSADREGGQSPASPVSTRPEFGPDGTFTGARPGRRGLERQPYIWFILPAFAVYAALFLYPTVRAFYLSLFDWPGFGPVDNFIWLRNFSDVVSSRRFHQAAWNSTKLFLVIFVLQNTVSLGLAVMLNRRSRMTHVYRAIIFMPVIMSAVATGVIWILMLDPIIGIVNPFLAAHGLGGWQREWQADQFWAMKTVYLVQFWQWNGMAVVLYLAGLQNVPEDLRHAALVDGAKPWQVFRDVTFPMLAPAFTIVTALSFILIYRAFDLIYVLGGTTGQPDGATLVVGVLIYGDAFGTSSFSNSTRMSFAIAEGVTLFIFLAGVSGLLIKGLGRREEAMH